MKIKEVRRHLVELRNELEDCEMESRRSAIKLYKSSIERLQINKDEVKDGECVSYPSVSAEGANSLAFEAQVIMELKVKIDDLIDQIGGEGSKISKSESSLKNVAQKVIDAAAASGSREGDSCLICNSGLYENAGDHINCPLPDLARVSGARMRFPDEEVFDGEFDD